MTGMQKEGGLSVTPDFMQRKGSMLSMLPMSSLASWCRPP